MTISVVEQLVRLLSVVSLPCTFGQLHVGEDGLEGWLLGRACVDAKTYLPTALMHVAYAHLGKMFAVLRALYAIVILSA